MTEGYRFRALGVSALAILAAVVGLTAQTGVGPPPSTTQAAPAVGTGAISGVVIDGGTNQPIGGAVVALTGGGPRGAVPVPGRLATDAQGRFVFTRLPAASYTVSAAKHGFSTARYGQTDPMSGARTIALTDGQWFLDGRIVMWRTSAISGTITDETGEPLVGAMVRVIARVIVAGRPQLASGTAAKTDDRGRYRVAGLGAGSYVVLVPSVQAAVPSSLTLEDLSGVTAESMKAAEAGGRPVTLADPTALVVDASNRLIAGSYVMPPPASADGWSYPPVFFPTARSIGEASVVDLGRAEERTGVDVRLTPVRTVRVSGVLQSPAGATPNGMVVRLLPVGNEALGFGSETATALATSDGAFTLLRVPPGSYTLSVSRSTMEYMTGDSTSLYAAPRPPGCIAGGGGFFTLGNAPGSVRASFQTCGGNATFSARMPLTVGDRDMPGVVVPLQRAVSISGRIVFADGAPGADSPLARMGVRVFAEPANGDALLGLPSGGRTPDDPTGFKVDGLLRGAYVLQPLPPGAGDVKSIEWQGRDYTDRAFDTTAGNDITDVTVTMTSEITRLSGTVRDAKGAVAAVGQVIVFPTDRALWTNYGLRPGKLRSARVSTSGAYAVALRAGEYFVAAIDQGGPSDWMEPRFLEAASAGATRITVLPSETKTVDLSITTVKVAR